MKDKLTQLNLCSVDIGGLAHSFKMTNELCEEEDTFISHINLIVHEEVFHYDFMDFCFIELDAIVLILALKIVLAHVDHICH